jgi:hypothetical protein
VMVSMPGHYVGLVGVAGWMADAVEAGYRGPGVVMEPGCSVGANLAELAGRGWEVVGIEVNGGAREMAMGLWPGVGRSIVTGAVEEKIGECGLVDVVMTQGFLMHLPPESEWVFGELSARAREAIVVNEVEDCGGWMPELRFSRNYREVFEGLGWRQQEERRPVAGAISMATTRIFVR